MDARESRKKKPRGRFQYSLWTLMVLVPLLGTAIGKVGMQMMEAAEDREHIAAKRALQRLGARFHAPPGRTRLLDVQFGAKRLTDGDLVHLKRLRGVTSLSLKGTGVTDAGMVHVKSLTFLQALSLENTNISDAGLLQLTGLSELEDLWVGGTRITEDGIKRFQAALPEPAIHGSRSCRPQPD